jgi:hypothetical protein
MYSYPFIIATLLDSHKPSMILKVSIKKTAILYFTIAPGSPAETIDFRQAIHLNVRHWSRFGMIAQKFM